jgi:hypothetical protein
MNESYAKGRVPSMRENYGKVRERDDISIIHNSNGQIIWLSPQTTYAGQGE